MQLEFNNCNYSVLSLPQTPVPVWRLVMFYLLNAQHVSLFTFFFNSYVSWTSCCQPQTNVFRCMTRWWQTFHRDIQQVQMWSFVDVSGLCELLCAWRMATASCSLRIFFLTSYCCDHLLQWHFVVWALVSCLKLDWLKLDIHNFPNYRIMW